MIKNIYKIGVVVILISVVLVQCKNQNNFMISKGTVGKLTQKTTINELSELFKKDSIVKKLAEGAMGDNYFQEEDQYEIYGKGGVHLLTIVPKESLDSTSTIKSIQIFDARYKTKSNLNLNSTFQQINANNKINNIEASLSSVTLFIDNLNITLTIDKEQLGLKNFNIQKVSLDQIPDLAKIKSFVVWFN